MTPEELTPEATTERLIERLAYASPEIRDEMIRSKLPFYIKKAIDAERERIDKAVYAHWEKEYGLTEAIETSQELRPIIQGHTQKC